MILTFIFNIFIIFSSYPNVGISQRGSAAFSTRSGRVRCGRAVRVQVRLNKPEPNPKRELYRRNDSENPSKNIKKLKFSLPKIRGLLRAIFGRDNCGKCKVRSDLYSSECFVIYTWIRLAFFCFEDLCVGKYVFFFGLVFRNAKLFRLRFFDWSQLIVMKCLFDVYCHRFFGMFIVVDSKIRQVLFVRINLEVVKQRCILDMSYCFDKCKMCKNNIFFCQSIRYFNNFKVIIIVHLTFII